MPGSTPVYGFPYPEPTDLVADYPALGQDLAEDIEAVLPTIGGTVRIATVALSGGTVNINTCFSATYVNYLMVLSGTADNSSVSWRSRNAGTTDAGANYDVQILSLANTTFSNSRSTGINQGPLGNMRTTWSGIWAVIYNPFNATPTQVFSQNSDPDSGGILRMDASRRSTAAGHDSLALIAPTGTGFTGGNVRIYGIRD